MTVRLLSRRQMLLGAGGFSLGLPWLGSLLPREVEAQGAPLQRRFVAFATGHGGLWETAMFPKDDMLTDEMKLYSDHTVHRGDLIRTENGATASVSPVLTAAADRLTERLVSRMNVLRGIDIPFYIAHHTGGHLGNFGRKDGTQDMEFMPTIDQLLAWSPSFYPDLSGITERSLILGDRGRLSWNWSSPSDRQGEIQEVTSEKDPSVMFQRVFLPEDDPNEPAARPPVVDRVLESYQSLRQSNRRLSREDKQRLDDHMDRLAELQRRLNVDSVRPASCGDASAPAADADRSDPIKYHAALNDVITAAFLCGTSRIAVVKINESSFVPYAGDWHQDVAHQWNSDEPQKLLQEANQKAFEYAMVDLAHKLDVEEAPGQSLLDSAIVQWTQESGEETHESRSAPVVTFGAGGGGLLTGNYCDYRKMDPAVRRWSRDIGPSGLFHAQWLAQVMQTLGMPASEFADVPHNGSAGYGYDYVETSYKEVISDGVAEKANEPLPFLT